MIALVLRLVTSVLAVIGQQTARYLSRERKVIWRMVQKVQHSERNMVSLQARSPKIQGLGLQSWGRQKDVHPLVPAILIDNLLLM